MGIAPELILLGLAVINYGLLLSLRDKSALAGKGT